MNKICKIYKKWEHIVLAKFKNLKGLNSWKELNKSFMKSMDKIHLYKKLMNLNIKIKF